MFFNKLKACKSGNRKADNFLYTILELYKKTGTSKENVQETNRKFSKMNIVLGYFDRVGFLEGINSLDNLFEDRELPEIDSYLRYELILFDLNIDNVSSKKSDMEFFKKYSEAHIIQITALKIKRELCLYFKYAEHFLYVARQAVEECLQEHGLHNAIKFEIWGGLGSYDIVIAMAIEPEQAGAYMHKMLQMPHVLRNKIIDIEEYKEKIKSEFSVPKNPLRSPRIESLKNTNRHYIFEFSTSFITINKKLDISKLSEEEKFHAQIRCVSHNYIVDKTEIVNKTKGEKYNIDAFYMLGDHDYSFDIKDINLKDLFNLYLKNQTSFLKHRENGYDIFRSTQTNLCYGEEIKLNNLALQSYSQKDNAINIWNNINELYTNYIAYRKGINVPLPVNIKHSFKSILTICHNLLFSDLGYITGIKTAKLLYEAHELIFRKSDQLSNLASPYLPSNETLTDFAQNISYILPSYFQMDSVLLDNVNTIDGTSPISKLFSFYEQLLKRVYREINQDGVPINLFLTVGRTSGINNKLFFRDDGRLKDEARFVAINLSNRESLSFGYSYPFLLHEIGHYAKFDKERVTRNLTFYDVSILYLVARIKKKLDKRNNRGIDDPETFYKKTLPNLINSKIQKLLQKHGRSALEERLDGCVKIMYTSTDKLINMFMESFANTACQLEGKIHEIRKKLRIITAIGLHQFDNRVKADALFAERIATVKKYVASREFHEVLVEINASKEKDLLPALIRIKSVMHEAQADVLTIKMKRYTFWSFIDKYYPYLKQTGFKIEENQELFMRLGIVLLYFYKNAYTEDFKNNQLLAEARKHRQNYTEEEENFINAIFEQIKESEDLLIPIADYLRNGMEDLKKQKFKEQEAKRQEQRDIPEIVHGDKDFNLAKVKPCFFISYWLKEMQEILEFNFEDSRPASPSPLPPNSH